MQNRRTWLKNTLALTASLPISVAFVEQLMAAPASKAEKDFVTSGGKLVLLGSNENPYGPSIKAREAVNESLSLGNRYAFDTIQEFKKIIADKEGVTPDHILPGNGSSELLCLTGLSVGLEGGRIVSASPTFQPLMRYAEKFGAIWDKVNVDNELKHDLEALAKAVRSETKLIYLVNPNNPTGTLIEPDKFIAFCEEMSKNVTVFSDEAYLEFLEPEQQKSMVELVKQGRDVIVSKTFSKIFGLAGMRIGYVIATPDRIKSLRAKQWAGGVNINQMALAAAKASLDDLAFQNMTRAKNAEARTILTDYLTEKKISYGKSYTNFVFFPAPIDGKTILRKTEEKGYQIRIWDYDDKEWCRVSIGTLEEIKGFVKAFDEIVS